MEQLNIREFGMHDHQTQTLFVSKELACHDFVMSLECFMRINLCNSAIYDLVGAYLMPANAVMLTVIIWDPLFKIINSAYETEFLSGASFVTWWLLLQIVLQSILAPYLLVCR